ncbi:MAG: molybdopterin molybdotransferase MoeA [Sneathiellales bacterium]|nr:molybdopterin molybdotransferase MoeA [Sneathiellales bacterium]
MPRLPNDCFAISSEMISVGEALEKIASLDLPGLPSVSVPLWDAEGYILYSDIHSSINVPQAGNSAVDGYAFAFSGLGQETYCLKCIGRSAAGDPFKGVVKSGECIKIFTGAILPDGCDTIAMIEDCAELEGELVRIPESLKKGANFRQAGEDIKAGQLVLKAGTRLRPQEIGQLASIGKADIEAVRKPVIGLFSTGDELLDPGNAVFPGSVFDSNRFMLNALLRKCGADVIDFGILEDEQQAVASALKKAADQCDILVTSGGVSMGDEDHVKAAVEAIGSLNFWRIAIKPGRPLAMGQIANTAFIGLPGNPVASMVCALMFIRPLIRRMTREIEASGLKAVMGKARFSMIKKPGRREWLRGRAGLSPDGSLFIEKYTSDGSGIISSLTWANGIIELPENLEQIKEGDPIRFLSFTELFG